MICPDCNYDNIDGVDVCEQCGQSLVDLDPAGSELEQSISRHSIEVVCRKDPIGVSSSTTVREAIAEMVRHKIGCLLVLEEGALVGVFTERDVLNRVSDDLTATLDQPVSEFMTAAPVSVTRKDSIAYALQSMDLGGYRHMPVVSESTGRPNGIISVRDILRFLCIRFAELRA